MICLAIIGLSVIKPDIKVQVQRETDPGDIGDEQKGGDFPYWPAAGDVADGCAGQDDQAQQRAACALADEKQVTPEKIETELKGEKQQYLVFSTVIGQQNQSHGKTGQDIKQCPDERKNGVRWRQR